MLRLFKTRARRDTPPIQPQPPASRDWGRGDLAKCVVPGPGWIECRSRAPTAGPSRLQIVRVADVIADEVTVWLTFDGFRDCYYPAGYFRKLRACTAEFHAQVLWPVTTPELVP